MWINRRSACATSAERARLVSRCGDGFERDGLKNGAADAALYHRVAASARGQDPARPAVDEYLRADDRPLAGFDLNPREPSLSSHFPHLVWTVDIADTRGQMELFDQLIADDMTVKVIDLGYAPFEQFFSVMAEIGFMAEARRHAIEPIVLFITDRAPATAHAYQDLRGHVAEDDLRSRAQRSRVGDLRQGGLSAVAPRIAG